MTSSSNLMEIRNLKKWYKTRTGFMSSLFGDPNYIKAVDDVSFNIKKGEILGLAGQSGCGKSTLAELLMHLETPDSGSMVHNGRNITEFNKDELKKFRRDCQMIFQDPYDTMNPRFTVQQTVTEPLKIHDIGKKHNRKEMAIEAIEDAGLEPAENYLQKFPGELSGGERQRVLIAKAIVLEPDLLIADEPVSMLDVSVRTSILHLFHELQEKRDLSMVYVSHDLSTINYLADRTMIMYLGKVVELGPTDEVIHNPKHPYTETLINSIHTTDPDAEKKSKRSDGDVPDPSNLPQGCSFHPRCKYSTKNCEKKEPNLEFLDSESKSRKIACYHPVEESNIESKLK